MSTKISVSDVYALDGKEYMIVSVPTRKNQVNYKMVCQDGKLYKANKVVIRLDAEFVRTDQKWMDAFTKGEVTVDNDAFVPGDEVVVNTPSNQTINGKTAYVVKMNAKSVQIVIPHVGTWNVSSNFIAKN